MLRMDSWRTPSFSATSTSCPPARSKCHWTCAVARLFGSAKTGMENLSATRTVPGAAGGGRRAAESGPASRRVHFCPQKRRGCRTLPRVATPYARGVGARRRDRDRRIPAGCGPARPNERADLCGEHAGHHRGRRSLCIPAYQPIDPLLYAYRSECRMIRASRETGYTGDRAGADGRRV